MTSVLLFSGHNDRAVIALCRFLAAHALPFVIVSAGRDDAIHRTAYRDRVVFDRIDARVTVELLTALVDSAAGPLVYCPTTEYINTFVLEHRAALTLAGLRIGLPAKAVYERLTSKWDSQALVAALTGVQAPAVLPIDAASAPCVLKPLHNVADDRVLYPLLCPTPDALTQALGNIDRRQYFAQTYVDGQSFYLCAYLARDGRWVGYWQENLAQQPGGKSIVLARVCGNPGLDAEALMTGLHAAGYHGPLMLEVLRDAQGTLHYIEINPRFWGPLQLSLAACPALLRLYAAEQGLALPALAEPPAAEQGPSASYYAWEHGARQPGLRLFPASPPQAERARLLHDHDIYAGADTADLHGRH